MKNQRIAFDRTVIHKQRRKLGKVVFYAVTLVLGEIAVTPATCQIIPDNTLPVNSSVTPGCTHCTIDGGTVRGVNLFHSFREFSVPTGGSAYFNNGAAIQAIFTRVTGSNLSSIDGLLKANGTANLFLLNPNGILFGPNARLELGGSFFASTANSFKFFDGSEFSATNPQTPPLLTVNITPGLQWGNRPPAAIRNAGNLEAGRNLALVGGTVISTGTLEAPRGSVMVAAVAGDAQIRQVSAQQATLFASDTLRLPESQLQTTGNLSLLAGNTVWVRDSPTTPVRVQVGGDLTIVGKQGIDILALNHPGAAFQSGRALRLISDGVISGDAHFASNGAFEVLNWQGQPGTLVSKYDPIISVNGNAVLGNYTGASLKVEATGNIQIGTVSITAPDLGLTGSDPDIPVLTSQSALILRAGVPQLANPANFVPNQQYSILNLGTLGGNYSRADGINNLGQVVGRATDATGNDRAFRTAPNAPINPLTDNLGTLGGNYSQANAINDVGQVVGYSWNTVGNGYAFLTASNAAINPLTDNLGSLGGSLGGVFSTALGINVAGQVVGRSFDVAGNTRAFRTFPNTAINPLTDNLGNLGGNFSNAFGINAFGQVVGESTDAAGNGAFRTAPNIAINPFTDNLGTLGGNYRVAEAINAVGQVVGVSTDTAGNDRAFRTASNAPINPLTDNLGTLGGNYSWAYGINNLGQVVGVSTDAASNFRAFLYDNGFMIDLNSRISSNSGWILTAASAINDNGQIAGTGVIGGQTRAFLLTPVPTVNSVGSGTLTVGTISQSVGDPLTVILSAKSDVQTRDIITNGGDIRITSGATFNTTNSGLYSHTGNIAVQANTVVLDNSTLNSGTLDNGRAGNIAVQADSIDLLNGSDVVAEGSGDGGSVVVTANTLTLAGVNAQGKPSQIFTNALGSGNAGAIQVVAGNLGIQDGAAIASTSVEGSTGKSGNVSINADVISLHGTSPDGLVPSRISTATFTSGNAGDLILNTRQLAVQAGAVISTASLSPNPGAGRSGNLTLNATDSVFVSGTSANGQIPSALSTDTFGPGAAGTLSLNTQRLTVQDGAAVSVSTFGTAQGGQMIVNASDAISLNGTAANGFASGLYAQAFGSGNAGDLQVTTGQLTVSDRATITVASGNAADTRVPTGQPNFTVPVNNGSPGNAGILTVTANNIFLNRQGKLLASTASGEGGNITLDVRDILLLRYNSLISATAGTAQAGGNGGNITIKSGFVLGVLSENSDIIANAFTGSGGRVNITTNAIYGLRFQPSLTPFSDITASSQFGLSGTVILNTLNIDPSRGLTALPTNLEDASQQISQTCSPNSSIARGESRFVVTGRGGLPASPDETQTRYPELDDLGSSVATAQVPPPGNAVAPTSPVTEIVEAQGWIQDTTGKISLVARSPKIAVHPLGFSSPNCSP